MISVRSQELVTHIFSDDPALDKSHEQYLERWDQFLKFGTPLPPIREGFKPTSFRLRRLSRRQFQYVMGKAQSEQATEAVALGLKSADDFYVGENPIVIETAKSEHGERVKNEVLDRIYAFDLFGELGLRILSLSTAGPFVPRSSEPSPT